MARYLTGIQNSGKPHLGNLLGAIFPALTLAKTQPDPAFFFIADMHTLTSSRDAQVNQQNTYEVAAAWLAAGFDAEKDFFYRQSDIPQVSELAWYLGCITPYAMLANAHSFKDKVENLALVSAGLFTYPVLMTADILLYDGTHVPVGKDQKQHLEIARDIANGFNRQVKQEFFILPEPVIAPELMTIPGTDGRKMSKSYNNVINVFAPEAELRKTIMGIKTDSTPVAEAKDPDKDTIFKLYSLIAPPEKVLSLRQSYLLGGMGYGEAKQRLLEVILRVYGEMRERHAALLGDVPMLENILRSGAEKVRPIADAKLSAARKLLGFS